MNSVIPWAKQTSVHSIPVVAVLSVVFAAIGLANITSINAIAYYPSYEALLRLLPSDIVKSINILTSQLKWATAALFLSATIVVSVVISIRIILYYASKVEILSVAIVTAIILSAFTFAFSVRGTSFAPAFTSQVLANAYQCSGVDCKVMNYVIGALNSIAALPIVFLTIAASSLLFNISSCDGLELAERMDALVTILYTGSIVLVSGVYEINCLFRWPVEIVTTLPPDSAQTVIKALSSMADTISFTAGAIFSLILVSLFLPAATIVTVYAKNEAKKTILEQKQQPTKTNINNQLVLFGFSVTPLQLIFKVIATAGPLVLGSSVNSVVTVLRGLQG